MVKLLDIIQNFEKIVPKNIQWEKDNCGLQIGDTSQDIQKILLCLEVTEQIIQEALDQQVNLIFTHHPLIFNPIKQITTNGIEGKLLTSIIKNDIAVYSAHTNLDKFNHGVSFALAELLDLQNIKTLVEDKELLYKLVTFIPQEHVENVTEELSSAGAGKIGEYEFCSFRLEGKGTFKGSDKSDPYLGEKGQKEYINETRLEMIFPRWKTTEILNALRKSHPYEEIAYDIYALENKSSDIGYGAIGELKKKIKASDFLTDVKEKIKIPFLRVAGDLNRIVSKVALLGGAGNAHYQSAIEKGADVFISSEISYHTFHDAMSRLVIVDAGHYETEIFILNELERILALLFKSDVEILKTKIKTNPIIYF
jgi:dinuclear metal center YbgI/SA1388 family protein